MLEVPFDAQHPPAGFAWMPVPIDAQAGPASAAAGSSDAQQPAAIFVVAALVFGAQQVAPSATAGTLPLQVAGIASDGWTVLSTNVADFDAQHASALGLTAFSPVKRGGQHGDAASFSPQQRAEVVDGADMPGARREV